MNFTLTSWMELCLRLGLGALGVFGTVLFVARFSRSGAWLRTLWRSAFVAWFLLLGAEVTGVGGLLWQSLAALNPRRVVPTHQTGRVTGATEATAELSEMTYRILPEEPQGLSGGDLVAGHRVGFDQCDAAVAIGADPDLADVEVEGTI